MQFFNPKKDENRTGKKSDGVNLGQKIYFNSYKKPLPTRKSFKERKVQTQNNFVPAPKFEDILKELGPSHLYNRYQSLSSLISSGQLLRDIKFKLLQIYNHILKVIFSRQTQLGLIFTFILALVGYTVYLSAFSTEFLIKNYYITFAEGSYVDKTTTEKMVRKFTQKGILNFIPDNHFWFLNSQTLTRAAKEVEPSITQVQLVGRYWPNTAHLIVSTQPILATLNINSSYYILSQNGRVIGMDYGGQKQKMVIVKANHKNVDAGELTKVFAEKRPDSKVGNNQLNRLYFINRALEKFQNLNINIIRTEVKTLYEKDLDVIFVADNETRIFMDSLNISIEDAFSELEVLFSTTAIGQDFRDGKLEYIDFRIRDRVYYCFKGRECQDKTEI